MKLKFGEHKGVGNSATLTNMVETIVHKFGLGDISDKLKIMYNV